MSDRSDRIYCSEQAMLSHAPLYGTAVPVHRWLMIEYPRPWRPKALEDNDLPVAVNDVLNRLPAEVIALSGESLRIQFIKQASSAEVVHPRVFSIAGNRLLKSTLPNYNALANITAADLVGDSLPVTESLQDPLYFVCTNGQRDVCCARFGLPLFESLRIHFGQRIWQTTHLGGHRYAPNVLCLPSGLVYGFVQPEHGESLVNAHDRDEVVLEKLRGRSQFSEVEQAAEYFSRNAHDLTSGHTPKISVRSFVDDLAEVMVEWPELTDEMELRVNKSAQTVLASCGAQEKHVNEFDLIKFESSIT